MDSTSMVRWKERSATRDKIIEALCNVLELQYAGYNATLAVLDSTGKEQLGTRSMVVEYVVDSGLMQWIEEEHTRGRHCTCIPEFAISHKGESRTAFLYISFVRTQNFTYLLHFASDSILEERLQQEICTMVESAVQAIEEVLLQEEIDDVDDRLETMGKQIAQSYKRAIVGTLAGRIAEEMQNPLSIVRANIQLLESGVGDASTRIAVINKHCAELDILVQQLVDISRQSSIANGRETLSLQEVIQQVLAFSTPQFERAGIAIEIQHDSELLFATMPTVQVQQIVHTILGVSKDCMKNGGTITVGAVKMNTTQALILISDTGIVELPNSITRVQETKLLEREYFAGKGEIEMCGELVKSYGGLMRIIHETGKGTSYKIQLPLA